MSSFDRWIKLSKTANATPNKRERLARALRDLDSPLKRFARIVAARRATVHPLAAVLRMCRRPTAKTSTSLSE